MSIPMSHIVDVVISTSPTAVPSQGFGQLLMMTDEAPEASSGFTVAERYRKYSNLAAVALDWNANSEVFKAASTFFGNKATDFSVGLMAAVADNGALQGAGGLVLADLQAIDNGAMTIKIDGADAAISGIDLSGAADLEAVRATIETALAAAVTSTTVTLDAGAASLRVVSPTTGTSSTVEFPNVTPLSQALGLVSGTLVPGVAVETLNDAFANILSINKDFYGIAYNRKFRDDETNVSALATSVLGAGKTLHQTSNDARGRSTNTDHLGAKIKGTSGRVLTTYSSSLDEYPCVAAAAKAFTVNFEGTNTTITLNLKVLEGITPEDITETELLNIKSHNMNVYTNIAGSPAYTEGKTANGTFFDVTHGVDWLKNRVQTEVYNTLYRATTDIDYTDGGVSALYQAADKALRQGVTNGLIAPGTDSNGVFHALGYSIYTVPVENVSLSDKSNRQYNGLSFVAVGSGSIHGANINGSFS